MQRSIGKLVIQLLIIAVFSFLLIATLSAPSRAETLLEKISRTGVLTAGARTDSVPFSYINDQKQWVGYSIDMLNLIRDRLEQQFSLKIQLNLVPVSYEDWIYKVQHSEVDLVCSSTSITQRRARDVAFSVPYFKTGTQFLVDVSRFPSPGQFRIGVIPGTVNDEVAKTYLRLAQFVPVRGRSAGLIALQQGRIDALASDGVLLEGLRQTLAHPNNYAVIPPEPYEPEIYGCMLSHNDSSLQELVDRTLIQFMQGVLAGASQDLAIFNTWFGQNGVAPVDQKQIFTFFQETVATQQPANVIEPSKTP